MRAGCGKSARPVRRAGTGNGTTVRIEAPALGESRRATATPLGLWSPRLSSTLVRPAKAGMFSGRQSHRGKNRKPRSLDCR
jgi:hypothetical protein